jgi:rRNA maturation endonuclease Nob1
MNDYYKSYTSKTWNIWRTQNVLDTHDIKCKNCRKKFKSDYKYTERCVSCEQKMFDEYFGEE